MISGQSLTCPKGASLTFEIDMDTGSDLTGATAQWALCESWFDNAKVYLTKTGVGDGLFIGQDAGVWKITVNLSPTDTLDVPSGLLYHDCKVLLQSGDVEDVANGPFSLGPSVNILNTNAPITRNLRSVPQPLSSIGQTAVGTVGALGSVEPNGFVNAGNSLTLGAGTTTYPNQLSMRTGLIAINRGVSGQFISTMDTGYASNIAPYYNPASSNTLIVEGGINDIISGSGTQSTIDTNLRSICAKAKTTGFKVYILTLTPVLSGASGWNSATESVRVAVNSDRTTNWSEFCDGVIDIASISSLADPSDTSHYSDGLHWTTVTNFIVAEAIRVYLGLAVSTTPIFTTNFTLLSTLPAGITLARATTGTQFDASGVMQIAAINAARFDHHPSTLAARGLLSEESRVNLSLGSNAFTDSAYWIPISPVTVAASGDASPDGTTDASVLTIPATAGKYIYAPIGAATVGQHVGTIFASVPTGTGKGYISFADGVTFTAQARSLTTSWQRHLYAYDFEGSGLYFGFGQSDTSTDASPSIKLFGAQVERGLFPTSYIPTTTTPVTRSADVIGSSSALTGYLAAGPSVWEFEDIPTGTISRSAYAAGAFDWPTNKWYRSMGVYNSGVDTSSHMTVGSPY